MNLDFCVKYPFTKDAKNILEKEEIQINERIVEKAVDRIKSALEGKIKTTSALHPSEKVEAIASYAASRMILSYMRNRFLINRYSIAESKKAFSYLGNESKENIKKVSDEFGIKIKEEDGKLMMHFSSYLKYMPLAIEYRLVNRDIKSGYVLITPHERIRIISEAVKEKIIRLPHLGKPPELIEEASKKLNLILPKIAPKEISFKKGENPPCIEELMGDVKIHKNLGHQARWFLAVYLINNGMETEKIMEIFSNLPDFSEKITKYQIEHAKKRGYVVPACGTLKGYGLCVTECRIGSPLNWRKKYGARTKEKDSK